MVTKTIQIPNTDHELASHLGPFARINVLSLCRTIGDVYRQKKPVIMLIAWMLLASEGAPHTEKIGANNVLVLHVFNIILLRSDSCQPWTSKLHRVYITYI